jgi:hypothetical protein
MEQSQIQIKEKLQMIDSQTSNISNLRISNRGEVSLSGNLKTDELQMILDDSQIKSKNYLEYQKYIDSELNKSSIIIGLIFSSLIGLIAFCFFNQSQKIQKLHSLGVSYVVNS